MKTYLAGVFVVVVIFRRNVIEGQEKVLKCTLENLRCELPFEFKGKMHESCTVDGVDNDRPWCPTKIYANGSAEVHYCMECWGDQRCYYTGDSFPDSSWVVSCPPGCYYVQLHTYGTDNDFSAASFVCAAAIHEGLIKNDVGGDVALDKLPWKRAFAGKEKNGIVSYAAKNEYTQRMMFKKDFKVAPTPHMILTNEKTMISSLTSGSVTTSSIVNGRKHTSGLTCDVQQGKIFWSDVEEKAIYSANFDGASVTGIKKLLLASQVTEPEMIAFDWIHRNLFWTDRERRSVSVSSMNGKNVFTLIKRDNFEPRGIAVDPKNGYFYIADSGQNPKIERCSMAKKDSCQTVVDHGIDTPTGIGIDVARDALCWTDSKIPQISCTNLDGMNRRDMKFSDERLQQPFAIALVDGRVYWTDLAETIVASADLETWDSFHIHLGDITNGRGLAFFDEKSQPMYIPNSCPGKRCRYLCVPSPTIGGSSPTCLCPERYKGKSDADECKIGCEEGKEMSQIDGKTCVDINECTKKHNFGGCLKPEFCTNQIGSHFCNCGEGYEAGRDGKSCHKIGPSDPCSPNPCKNGAKCVENSDKTTYNCTCEKGFKGKDCEDLDTRLEYETFHGAIFLTCIVPADVKNQIVWLLNRFPIDPSDKLITLEDEETKLKIQTPHYTHSGVFSCQFRYAGVEHIAQTLVKVPATPAVACGQSPGIDIEERTKTEKVLGGTPTKLRHAPFVAMLYRIARPARRRKAGAFCGGSLIDSKHVVTAEHCFRQTDMRDVTVYLGKLTTDIKRIELYEQSSKIKRFIRHSQYNPFTLHSDIIILVLQEEIYFSAGVKPICIAEPNDDSDEIKPRAYKGKKKKFGIVFGWGLTESDASGESGGKLEGSDKLLEALLPIVKDTACEQSHPTEITSSMFCVGGEEDKDACEGDSGGPFALWSSKRSRWYLAGIVSWGDPCGMSNEPGVYTRIGTKLRRWIREHVKL